MLGTALGEAAAADTIAIGAIDTGITYGAAATETGGFLGAVGGNAAVGAASSAAFGGSQTEIREGAAFGALGGVIGGGTGIMGRTAAEAFDAAGYLSSSAYMNAIQRGAIAGAIGGGFGSALGAAAGASGIIPGVSTEQGAKQGAIWGGLNGLFYGSSLMFQASKAELGATEVLYNNNLYPDNLPPPPLVREGKDWIKYKYEILRKSGLDKKYIVDFDGKTKALPGYHNPNATGGFEETKSSVGSYSRRSSISSMNDLSLLTLGTPGVDDFSFDLNKSVEIPMETETSVGNNFNIPAEPIEPNLNPADLEVDDAAQNQLGTGNMRRNKRRLLFSRSNRRLLLNDPDNVIPPQDPINIATPDNYVSTGLYAPDYVATSQTNSFDRSIMVTPGNANEQLPFDDFEKQNSAIKKLKETPKFISSLKNFKAWKVQPQTPNEKLPFNDFENEILDQFKDKVDNYDKMKNTISIQRQLKNNLAQRAMLEQYSSRNIQQREVENSHVETVVGNNFDPTTPLPMEPSLNAEDLQMLDALENVPAVQLFPASPNTQEGVINARESIETIAAVSPIALEYREMTPAAVEFETPDSTNITYRRRDPRGLPYAHRSTRKKYGLHYNNNLFS